MEKHKTNTTPTESPRDEFTGDLEAQYEGVERHQEYTVRRDAQQRADVAEKALSIDALTGLGNRKCFDAFIDEHSDLEANHGNIAVVFIDLNGLKHINDTRGHDAGDQVLVDVARFLEESFRDEDVKIHLSGDEFVVFCNNIGHAQPSASDDQRHSNGEFTDGLKKRLQEKVFINLPKELELAWDVAVCDKGQDKDLKNTAKRADLGMQVIKQEMKDAKLNWMQRLLRKLSAKHLPPR